MFYLFSQMLISLLLASAIGAGVAWWLQEVRARSKLDKLQQVILKQQRMVAQADNDIQMVNEDYDELKRQSVDEIQRLNEETRQIPVLEKNLEKSQLLVRQMLQTRGKSDAPPVRDLSPGVSKSARLRDSSASAPDTSILAPEASKAAASAPTSDRTESPRRRPGGVGSRVATGRRREAVASLAPEPSTRPPESPESPDSQPASVTASTDTSAETPTATTAVNAPSATRRGWASSAVPDIETRHVPDRDVGSAGAEQMIDADQSERHASAGDEREPSSNHDLAPSDDGRYNPDARPGSTPLYAAIEPYDDLQQIVGIGPR